MNKKQPKELYVEVNEGNYRTAGLYEIIEWWLYTYEGLEHLMEGGRVNPEVMYTINAILRRSLEKMLPQPEAEQVSSSESKGGV